MADPNKCDCSTSTPRTESTCEIIKKPKNDLVTWQSLIKDANVIIWIFDENGKRVYLDNEK